MVSLHVDCITVTTVSNILGEKVVLRAPFHVASDWKNSGGHVELHMAQIRPTLLPSGCPEVTSRKRWANTPRAADAAMVPQRLDVP